MARDQDLEVWENPTDSLVSIHKLDHRGVPYDALINPHRQIRLTPEERDMNENLCASDTVNPFRNGLLRPIKLVDNPDANPAVITANIKSDDELAAMLKVRAEKVFKDAVGEIDSAVTIRRLLSVAKVMDASMKQVEVINTRLAEVDETVKNMSERVVVDNPLS